MGKFADFNIKNNTENTNVSQSNSGVYNVQNNQVINNRTINNHYTKQNSNGDGDAGAFMAGAAILTVGIGFVIWSFFTHYQEIYPILKTGALFSPVLSIIGIIALVLREGANKQVISSQADSLIKISRIWADFFPANTSNQPI